MFWRKKTENNNARGKGRGHEGEKWQNRALVGKEGRKIKSGSHSVDPAF